MMLEGVFASRGSICWRGETICPAGRIGIGDYMISMSMDSVYSLPMAMCTIRLADSEEPLMRHYRHNR